MSQKHIEPILDDKLNFKEHTDKKLCKVKKGIGILRKMYHFILRSALLTIYKTFVRTHFDYGNIIWCLLKRGTTWNDLKRPETTKKRPEMTYNDLQRARNDLKRPETTWNNLQRVRNDLKRPKTSKKRPETTYNEQETTWNDTQWVRQNLQWPEHTYNKQRKDAKRPTTSRFWDYFTMWSNRFSSLTRFPPNI